MTDLAQFIAGLPKAELHLHIEGTLEPELLLQLAQRNCVEIPYASVDEARAAYRFQNLQDFLDIYYRGMSVLIEERDFYDLAWSYFDKARRQGVFHAEIFFDPQAHVRRGVPFAWVIDGIHRAMRDAEAKLGIGSKLIMCFLRDLSEEDALRTLEDALPYKDRIVAVGLDSAEVGNPPGKFRDAFERARRAGLRAVAHAGEEGPPEYVRDALDVLGAERIDHGVRSLEDARLVERLAADQVPLTVCPLSNVCLGVVDDIKRHPLPEMVARGLLVTVNSDDPAYFGGYVNENYLAVAESHALDTNALRALARNSFVASFLGDAEKADFVSRVDSYEAATTG